MGKNNFPAAQIRQSDNSGSRKKIFTSFIDLLSTDNLVTISKITEFLLSFILSQPNFYPRDEDNIFKVEFLEN